MVETRDAAGLPFESQARLRVGSRFAAQHFQRDDSVEPRITCLVNFAHPALTRDTQNLECAEPGARCQVGPAGKPRAGAGTWTECWMLEEILGV